LLRSVVVVPPIYCRTVGVSVLVYLATKLLPPVLIVVIGVTPPPISNVPLNTPVTYISPLDETAILESNKLFVAEAVINTF
jgi:hypothetical protein